jgi:hypothetical protein
MDSWFVRNAHLKNKPTAAVERASGGWNADKTNDAQIDTANGVWNHGSGCLSLSSYESAPLCASCREEKQHNRAEGNIEGQEEKRGIYHVGAGDGEHEAAV